MASRKCAAVVVGAGPAGVAVMGNLLERQIGTIAWIDPSFESGRVNRKYREVPRLVIYNQTQDFFTHSLQQHQSGALPGLRHRDTALQDCHREHASPQCILHDGQTGPGEDVPPALRRRHGPRPNRRPHENGTSLRMPRLRHRRQPGREGTFTTSNSYISRRKR